MAIRLIALDLDGTLLDSDKKLSERTHRTLQRCVEQGIILAFATGRIDDEMQVLLKDLRQMRYSINTNGAYVVDLGDGSMICSKTVAMNDVRTICRAVKSFDLMVELYADGKIYVDNRLKPTIDDYTNAAFHDFYVASRTGVDDFDGFIENRNIGVGKVNLHFRSAEQGLAVRRLTADMPYEISYQSARNLEFNHPGVNKGFGLKMLGDKLGIRPDEIMAIGDNNNDVPMIKYAGTGVAMANAEADIRGAADYTTLDNDHDGAAAAIERFALHK